MKKLILSVFVLLCLIGCEKENAFLLNEHPAYYPDKTITVRNSNKVDICHNQNIINVSVNALEAHLNHGDEVVFGQVGTYEITYALGSSLFIHEGEITESSDGTFSGYGQSLTTGQEWTLTGTIDQDGNYTFSLHYTAIEYTATASGTFECGGNGYNGDWSDTSNQAGTWSAIYLID